MSEDVSIVPGIEISASGLDAEQQRMKVIANNVANAHTTRDVNGKVFRRKEVVFAERLSKAIGANGAQKGVEVLDITEDPRDLKRVFKPGHPDADENGFLLMPNINPVEEMVDMMSATRAYEANLAAMKAAQTMARKALDIGK